MKILIADDMPETIVMLESLLSRSGHEVIAASNGKEALEILTASDISFVLTDWEMPVMNGKELVKAIRALNLDRYIYIIILTAKSGKNEMIEGLEAGADDYVVKPFNTHELRVRIRAGERILDLEKKLAEQNLHLSDAKKQLEHALSIIQKDIDTAAALQNELLPPNNVQYGKYKFNWFLIPTKQLAGDIFNYYLLDDGKIVFFLLDVAGHGVSSSMLSFTLNNILAPYSTENAIFTRFDSGESSLLVSSPAMLFKKLNEHFFKSHDSMQYFTIIYGIIDPETDKIKLSRAGHTTPIILKNDGSVQFIEIKGSAIALLSETNYEEAEFTLSAGDRLILYSDGITECIKENDEVFGFDRFKDFLKDKRNIDSPALLDEIKNAVIGFKHASEFEDDISALIIEKV